MCLFFICIMPLRRTIVLVGDLHCHTRLSDGSMGIDDLIIFAQKKGVTTIAVTDHDCLAGNVRAKLIGDRHGVRVIPGVELSATDSKRGARAHILCYLSDSPDRLEGLCRRNLAARKRASQLMMLAVATRLPITPEFIIKCASGSTNIYKQHIMHALMELGLTDSIYGELYEELFLGENSITVNGKFPEPAEILEAIHDAGGIAVLAHPALFKNYELLDELIPLGLDGIEVWHPTCNDDDIRFLTEKAKKNGLLMTGGSDFHGMYGNGKTTIGCCGTPEENIEALLSYKTRKRRQQARAVATKAAAEKKTDAAVK